MADIRKSLQKQAGRTKERILQNFGKADKTLDADFDINVANFNKQHAGATKMHQGLKNYYLCMKSLAEARNNLMSAINDLYEPSWLGNTEFYFKGEVSAKNSKDFCEELNSEFVTPMSSYVEQFPEIAKKITKRNRKLLDYDKCRHHLENLQSMKKREESKLSKARKKYLEANRNFKTINSELHDELQALYDSRITFFTSHIQYLFMSEGKYLKKEATLFHEMGEIIESLEKHNFTNASTSLKATGDGTRIRNLNTERKSNGTLSASPTSSNATSTQNTSSHSINDCINSEMLYQPWPIKQEEDLKPEEVRITILYDETFELEEKIEKEEDNCSQEKTETVQEDNQVEVDNIPNEESDGAQTGEQPEIEDSSTSRQSESYSKEESDYETASDNTECQPENGPQERGDQKSNHDTAVLYQVLTTHQFVAENADELSFDAGAVIDVVAFENSVEEEEGWLMGLLSGKKGLFPANFAIRK